MGNMNITRSCSNLHGQNYIEHFGLFNVILRQLQPFLASGVQTYMAGITLNIWPVSTRFTYIRNHISNPYLTTPTYISNKYLPTYGFWMEFGWSLDGVWMDFDGFRFLDFWMDF